MSSERSINMNNLQIFNTEVIPVYETEEGHRVVIGRELHERLQIETPYRKWFPRMCEYGFQKDADYTPDIFVHPQNKQETENHILSLDMAKHIAMMQRSEIGFTIRQKLIELEETVSDLSPELRLLIKIERQQKVQEKRIQAVDNDLQEFKKDMPILGIEESRITNAVKRKGLDCLGGKDTPAYSNKSLRGKIYADIYNQLKREFGVSSYKAIKRNQSDRAIRIISAYKMPYILMEQVVHANSQMKI